MRKLGRREECPARKSLSIAQRVLVSGDGGHPGLNPQVGETITRLVAGASRHGKMERWVLLRPLGPATYLQCETDEDWMRNMVTMRLGQSWLAAFVGSRRAM